MSKYPMRAARPLPNPEGPKPLRWWPSDSHRYLLLTPQLWQQATEMAQREEKERRLNGNRISGVYGVRAR